MQGAFAPGICDWGVTFTGVGGLIQRGGISGKQGPVYCDGQQGPVPPRQDGTPPAWPLGELWGAGWANSRTVWLLAWAHGAQFSSAAAEGPAIAGKAKATARLAIARGFIHMDEGLHQSGTTGVRPRP